MGTCASKYDFSTACSVVPAQTSNLQNTFVQKLAGLGLDPFHMLVVDFMHECELGTWKALFTHLVRVLYALPVGEKLVAILDSRYVAFV
jgi:hypothetical protein